MHFGIGVVTSFGGALGTYDLARAVEQHGFESLFVADHTHIPVKRESPYPTPPHGDLPDPYYRIGDPFITLAAAAAVTTTLKLATGVCLVVERDPIITAKQVATLDQLSNGRVIFGVGAGWNLEEMRNHGTNPKTRMRLLRERVEAMKAIWTEDEAEYHGEFVDFDPIFSWPKPVQDPHPPVLVGGGGPTVLDRVLAFGDGWVPAHRRNLDALHERIIELRERAAADGVGPRPVTITDARPEAIERYAEMGVERAFFLLEDGSGEEMLAAIIDRARAAGLAPR